MHQSTIPGWPVNSHGAAGRTPAAKRFILNFSAETLTKFNSGAYRNVSTSTLGKNASANMANNCMFAADPATREFRSFLIGPKGSEITGVDLTPEYKTMFVNIQHPGESPSERADPQNTTAISSWPDAD